MFWNPEVITTTGKSLRITQITFNIIYIMRTNINQGRIQSLAVMIVVLINNDQTPYLTYYRILGLTVHATSTRNIQPKFFRQQQTVILIINALAEIERRIGLPDFANR